MWYIHVRPQCSLDIFILSAYHKPTPSISRSPEMHKWNLFSHPMCQIRIHYCLICWNQPGKHCSRTATIYWLSNNYNKSQSLLNITKVERLSPYVTPLKILFSTLNSRGVTAFTYVSPYWSWFSLSLTISTGLLNRCPIKNKSVTQTIMLCKLINNENSAATKRTKIYRAEFSMTHTTWFVRALLHFISFSCTCNT